MTQGYTNSIYPIDTGEPVIANTILEAGAAVGWHYVDPNVENILNNNGSKPKEVSPQISDGLFLRDIAQSHHFTIHLSGINDTMMSMSELQTPNKTFSNFLPVKSMSLKYTSYENMSIPVAIFGDFPLLNKKRVSTIDLSCYDFDSNKLEYELRVWEAQCFPQGKYVAYLSDIAREFVYRGYSVEGKETLTYRVYVIPAGNVTVSRDYSANEAKMVNFSLVVVGDGQTCASGRGKEPTQIPIQDHGGGELTAPGSYATLYPSGYKTNYGNKYEFVRNDL